MGCFVTKFTLKPFVSMIMINMFVKSKIEFEVLFNVFVTNITIESFIDMIIINMFMKSKIEFEFLFNVFHVFLTNITIEPFICMIMIIINMFMKSWKEFRFLSNVLSQMSHLNLLFKTRLDNENGEIHFCHMYSLLLKSCFLQVCIYLE